MDSTTQQNAALVEESSAAVRVLIGQAGKLTELIARFQVGGEMKPTRSKSSVKLAAHR
jgi:hypothetical protein